MGTSKGYISPTRVEWSNSKRAVSTYLRAGDSESKANAVSKYADAIRSNRTATMGGTKYGSSFSSSAGILISFAKDVAEKGTEAALIQIGREDLIGKPPDIIIDELLDQCTNHKSSIEDSLAAAAISAAFDAMDIKSPDDLASIDLDSFLIELIIAFVNNDFDFHFYERISRNRSQEKTHEILEDIHGYISGTLRDRLTSVEISKINLSKMSADLIVSDMIDDAYSVFSTVYGVEVE